MNPAQLAETWSHADEMRSARSVQARLLVGTAPGRPDLEWAGLSLPERGVGGDFHDLIEVTPGRVALVVGDVSGRGVPAALLMATLRASLRSHYALVTDELAARLAFVNRLFVDCTAAEYYATLFVGEYDGRSGLLTYANCGHVPPLLVRPGLAVETLRPTASVVGLFEEWSCAAAVTRFAPNDLLLLVSDGVTEALDPQGEEFGERTLVEALLTHRDLRAPALVRALADEVRAFAAGGTLDDLTIAAARPLPGRRTSRRIGGSTLRPSAPRT